MSPRNAECGASSMRAPPASRFVRGAAGTSHARRLADTLASRLGPSAPRAPDYLSMHRPRLLSRCQSRSEAVGQAREPGEESAILDRFLASPFARQLARARRVLCRTRAQLLPALLRQCKD